ncbi:HD domain-containing protein [Streptomyces sp. SAS_270]|uniref:HD domain-containing protein n=1 Tax=Streptomyces sp. SAS_270 TaxID=3412748 RepID=UPI00403D4089
MGESRRALIVAVPQYELSDHFEDLTQTVGRDIELMTQALRSSGFSVELIGATPDEPALRSRIRSTISRVCATAPEDGTVLIHFTGHGLSVGGADYLVPADAQLTWATTPPQVALDSLIGLDLAELLRGCRAETVLLTVDACRDSADSASYGGPATNFPAWRDRVAVLFGCGPGQTCGSDEALGSHFSRALADALHADTSPRTVADVIAHTIRRTTEFARAAREEQTPTPHYAPSGPAAIGDAELCAGRTLQEEWTVAVRDPELWAAVDCDDARRGELQQALVRLSGECARWRATALAEVPDPWADDDYPVRVLARGLRPLIAPSHTQGGPLLGAGEFAVLAAAPFVREAVYAMGVKSVTAVAPFRLDPAVGDAAREPERVDLEHTFAAHALLWRKGRELAGRGRDEDAGAVAAWLLHRHVSAKEELWDTYAPQLLAPLAKALIGAAAAPARIGELTDELVRVCRQTAIAPAQPYQGERDTADTRWRLDELVRPDGAVERWRPRELSWLIGVAGLLGGDLRQLPGVLVDNIGITDGLLPAQAVASVRELRWARDRLSKSLDLDLPCPHPAVHAALEALTGWTDDAVQNIRRHVGPAEPAELLVHLPDRVTCGRLRPQYDISTKGDAYGVPLMRFGLAEDEMRELLMGTRLYGDRALALRELYQNALDACRYRQARLRYGKAARKIPYGWEGEIVFRQGTDDAGRPYVECEDNGVGMGHETLRGTFSRAGRRFEQSREYRAEQARWRRADPDLKIYPNSRFGVGVFSYFMLADEISIWTRATDEYGRADAGGGLRVDIASSGSLFRIRKSEDAQPGSGTRVRLYLQADDVDAAEELGKHIWRSDFAMRVERDGEIRRTWQEKALYYFGDHTGPVAAGPDLWWVEGKGCLLADGVQVNPGAMDASEASAREWLLERERTWTSPDEDALDWHRKGGHPFGCVVDLRETRAPDITTDRNRMLAYDEAWVDDRIQEACAHFTAPEWLTLEWLWAFAKMHPGGVERLTERLLAADARVTCRIGWNRVHTIDFRRIGCFPRDASVAALRDETGFSMRRSFHETDAVTAWRAAVLRAEGIFLGGDQSSLPMPESVEGYPQPQAWESRLTKEGYRVHDGVREAALALPPDGGLTLGDVLRRLRRYAITGLELAPMADVDASYSLTLDSVDCRILKGDVYRRGLLSPNRIESGETVTSVLKIFSTDADLPLGEALKRARRFAAGGFALGIPQTVAEPPADEIATARDLHVLSWHPRISSRSQEEAENAPSWAEYEEVVGRYGWLGLSPESLPGQSVEARAQASSEGSPSARDWSREENEEFQRFFGARPYTWSEELSLRQLARASGALDVTLAEVVARYTDVLAERKMRTPDLGDLADRTFTRLDSDLLGAALREVISAYETDTRTCPAPLFDTALAVREVQAPKEEVTKSLGKLATLGLVRPEASALVEHWMAVPVGDWGLFPGADSLQTTGYDHRVRGARRSTLDGGIDVLYAFVMAASARMTIGSVAARLNALGPLLGLDTSELVLPPEPSPETVRPTAADVEACCEDSYAQLDWTTPSPARLVAHARADDRTLGESMTILSRYAFLGAQWSEPEDCEGSGSWREHRPTACDSALFEPDLVGGLTAGALELLRVAARFGWRIDRAWDRLALYRPFGLELLVGRPEFDTVPTWQDLILLTEHYTGSAPPLSGAVTARRIAVTARELERTTGWVHDRLTLYASLFGLVVPRDFPAEPAATPAPEPPYRADAE